jgi:uncharacterized membrane protein affecting hemolysin expression
MTDATKKKFVVTAFSAGMALGLLFTSISFIDWQHSSKKDSLFYLTAAQAKLISSNVKCSLAFNDTKDANEILDSLKTQNHIAFAGIYDCDGKTLACYYRDDVNKQDFIPLPPSKTRFRYRDGYLIVSEPVIDEHEHIGTVCLWAQP